MRPPVVVLVGAGLSTASGIPDYRGTHGLWARYDKDEFHIQRLLADPVRFWDRRVPMTKETRILDAEPNDGHHILARAMEGGRIDMIVTQNIDGLHQKAGTPSDKLIEVHGNGALCRCLDCGDTHDTRQVIATHRPGVAPTCACGGILKPDVVLFGEPVTRMPDAEAACAGAGTLVAVGTSLQVWPVAGLVSTARQHDAEIVIVNAEPTPFDGHADRIVRGDLVDALRRLFDGHDPHRA